ncbi:hypothetical protein [Aquibacillus salsiterrae]|uniref:Uncharacterized protein n=1 Tax=Aquibacillus salsiterrae TaxID=2950439 RepID=A0A9X4AFR5_9BACI|nr:hypothetical protein [Aquibacillus salsiterrae]MDC3418297.1 hypothetical protein [Aquibacillus salsiterrae]
MMDFLYFPDDKSEYIPAVISLSLFVIGSIVTMYLFQRSSKKEAEQTEAKYNKTNTNFKPPR